MRGRFILIRKSPRKKNNACKRRFGISFASSKIYVADPINTVCIVSTASLVICWIVLLFSMDKVLSSFRYFVSHHVLFVNLVGSRSDVENSVASWIPLVTSKQIKPKSINVKTVHTIIEEYERFILSLRVSSCTSGSSIKASRNANKNGKPMVNKP
jgi:hypothetical protein